MPIQVGTQVFIYYHTHANQEGITQIVDSNKHYNVGTIIYCNVIIYLFMEYTQQMTVNINTENNWQLVVMVYTSTQEKLNDECI